MDVLTGISAGTLGIGSGWALVAVFVLLVYRGNLVPRRTYDDVVHDRDEWRAAHRISEAARIEGEKQRSDLAESARAVNSLLRALQKHLALTAGQGDESS